MEVCEKKVGKNGGLDLFVAKWKQNQTNLRKKNRKYKKNIFPGDKKLFTTKKIMILGIYLEETSHISYQQLTQQLTELNLLGSPRLMT